MRVTLPSWADIWKWKLKIWGWNSPSFLLWQPSESSWNCRDDSDFSEQNLKLRSKVYRSSQGSHLNTLRAQISTQTQAHRSGLDCLLFMPLALLRVSAMTGCSTCWGRGTCRFHQLSCCSPLSTHWALFWEINDELLLLPTGVSQEQNKAQQ